VRCARLNPHPPEPARVVGRRQPPSRGCQCAGRLRRGASRHRCCLLQHPLVVHVRGSEAKLGVMAPTAALLLLLLAVVGLVKLHRHELPRSATLQQWRFVRQEGYLPGAPQQRDTYTSRTHTHHTITPPPRQSTRSSAHTPQREKPYPLAQHAAASAPLYLAFSLTRLAHGCPVCSSLVLPCTPPVCELQRAPTPGRPRRWRWRRPLARATRTTRAWASPTLTTRPPRRPSASAGAS
jgi:hypothetical protein